MINYFKVGLLSALSLISINLLVANEIKFEDIYFQKINFEETKLINEKYKLLKSRLVQLKQDCVNKAKELKELRKEPSDEDKNRIVVLQKEFAQVNDEYNKIRFQIEDYKTLVDMMLEAEKLVTKKENIIRRYLLAEAEKKEFGYKEEGLISVLKQNRNYRCSFHFTHKAPDSQILSSIKEIKQKIVNERKSICSQYNNRPKVQQVLKAREVLAKKYLEIRQSLRENDSEVKKAYDKVVSLQGKLKHGKFTDDELKNTTVGELKAKFGRELSLILRKELSLCLRNDGFASSYEGLQKLEKQQLAVIGEILRDEDYDRLSKYNNLCTKKALSMAQLEYRRQRKRSLADHYEKVNRKVKKAYLKRKSQIESQTPHVHGKGCKH